MKWFGKTKEPMKEAHGDATEERKLKPTAPAEGVCVLGSGCSKCQALEKAVCEALEELDMDTKVVHVTDFAQIAAYGVMSTPALVVDGKVVSSGKVLQKEAVKKLILEVRKCQ